MLIHFYNDETRHNYTAIGFTIENHWYLEIWSLFPYALVWFSMSRIVVRRDLSSVFFYMGLMIHEYIGRVRMVPWEFSILSHYICFTACSLYGSMILIRTLERTLGFAFAFIMAMLMFTSKLISNEKIEDLNAAMFVGFATGVLWFFIMRVLDDSTIWYTVLARRSRLNCVLLRHTRGISNKTLFEYYLTHALNVRRNNIINNPSITRDHNSSLTAETHL